MYRVGCLSSVWLTLCTLSSAFGALAILFSDTVRQKLTQHPIPFGNLYLDTAYLIAIAVLCIFIACGEIWALHLWLLLGIAAFISLIAFQSSESPPAVLGIPTSFFHVVRPALIYVFFAFGGRKRETPY
jgi:hypothetical protein